MVQSILLPYNVFRQSLFPETPNRTKQDFAIKIEFELLCEITVRVERKFECALVVKILDQIGIRQGG